MFGWSQIEKDRALVVAAGGGTVKEVEELLKRGANPNFLYQNWAPPTALGSAISNGRAAIVDLLLTKGADPNQRYGASSPLKCALERDNPDIIKSLAAAGADMSDSISYDIRRQNALGISMLLGLGVDPNIRGKRESLPIFTAIGYNVTEAVKLLLPHIKDINAVDAEFDRPLVFALKQSRHDAIKLLLEAGADCVTPDLSGESIVILASTHSPQSLPELMMRGADMFARSKDGRTALHYMATSGAVKRIESLLDHGLDINGRDIDGSTPLMYGVGNGRKHAVEFLLAKGADINLMDNNGATAFVLAKGTKQSELMDLLRPSAEDFILLDADQLSKVSSLPALKREITDIFNFRERERIRIITNLETKQESHSSEKFDMLTGSPDLAQAFEKYKKSGGKADSGVLKSSPVLRPNMRKLSGEPL